MMKYTAEGPADVLIVGSGGAGMRAAIAARDRGAEVLVLSKGRFGVSGSTVTACADVSVDSKSICSLLQLPGDPEDSMEQFYEDIMKSGYGLNRPELVRRFVQEAPRRVKEMLEWGARVRHVAVSPGHKYRRAVTISGKDFAHTLMRQAAGSGIRILEHTAALELLTENGRVKGVCALDLAAGEIRIIRAKTVILAAGGAMNVFPVTTAPADLSGDGMALAYRAGAELVDMEFPMFLLGCCDPPALRGSNYPFVLMCRAGAYLYNREGERFMEKWDPERKEKSSRDKIAVAAATEILEGRGGPNGGVFVSVKHIPRNVFEYYLEWYEGGAEQSGFHPRKFLPDLMDYGIEAIPSAHFWNGGIRIDENGRTTLDGLYAAGECTGGLHGANRLSGNAMSEILVWGSIAGENAAEEARNRPAEENGFDESLAEETAARYEGYLTRPGGGNAGDVVALKKRLKQTALETIGPVREERGLRKALEVSRETRMKLEKVGCQNKDRVYNREWIDAADTANMCDIVEMTASAALTRGESLSSHYRRDAARGESPQVRYNVVVKCVDKNPAAVKVGLQESTGEEPAGEELVMPRRRNGG